MNIDLKAIAAALAITISSCFTAAGAPADTVKLWNGAKDHFKQKATLYAFRPENPNGISVIVCPGGSYHWLDEKGEGFEVGEWLSAHGITAFVLMYRIPGPAEFVWHSRLVFRGIRHPDMISDAQKAMKWVKSHSEEYGIDEDKIGMMGFSAGGHLVMSAACFSSTDFPALTGDTTTVALRPAFVAPIYPVVTMKGPFVHRRSRRGLLGDSWQGRRALRDSLSLEDHIPADCPPVFLVNCVDDPIVDYRNSELLDSALTTNGIDHEYHQYEKGGHGFGVSEYYGSPESRQWRGEFLRWLDSHYPEAGLQKENYLEER